MKLISWIRHAKQLQRQQQLLHQAETSSGSAAHRYLKTPSSPSSLIPAGRHAWILHPTRLPRVLVTIVTRKQWTTRILGLLALVSVIALTQTTVIGLDGLAAADSSDYEPPKILINSTSILVRPGPCSESGSDEVSVVVVVTSHPGNLARRNAWRQNSPSEELRQIGVRRVFLLGQVNNDQQVVINKGGHKQRLSSYPRANQSVINKEISLYGDIVQGSFLDAYKNLTLKHVMGLEWASTSCPNATYVIKMDDDIAVDFYQLVSLLNDRNNSAVPRNGARGKEILLGLLQLELDVVRDPSSKWFVHPRDYPNASYPNFLSGWVYVASMGAAKRLAAAALKHEFFWIDDVLVTGIIPHELGIERQSLSSYYSVFKEHLQCCVENDGKYGQKRVRKVWNPTENFWCDYVAAPVGDDDELLAKFLSHSRRCYVSQKCRRRSSSKGGAKSIRDTCVYLPKLRPLKEGKGEVLAVKV